MQAAVTVLVSVSVSEPRESAREKLDALVKDTAAKVAVDKPKAKNKSKKGLEL